MYNKVFYKLISVLNNNLNKIRVPKCLCYIYIFRNIQHPIYSYTLNYINIILKLYIRYVALDRLFNKIII